MKLIFLVILMFKQFVDPGIFVTLYDQLENMRIEQRYIDRQNAGTIKYPYDKLKDDDIIEDPYYYDSSYVLTDDERDLIERTVMHEAGWCPDYRLLILTAQCFRNACELNDWRPDIVHSKCGYAAMSYANPRAIKAVQDVFDRGLKCVDEPIFCYYNRTLVSSPDHEKNNLAIDIDGNRFFY